MAYWYAVVQQISLLVSAL